MPRCARTLSESGYMHLIVRGVGKQIMFEEEEDYRKFLSALEQYCAETEIKICAYCLMENHVHLLVLDPEGNTPQLMKKLGVSYALYFNRKYERCGHLLQDRYLSEPVEDDAYLLTVFRYILDNPRKAGICSARDYRWSSYAQYDHPSSFMDLSLVHSLIGDKEKYDAFIKEANDDQCLEYDKTVHDDRWAKNVIRKYLGVESGTAVQKLTHTSQTITTLKLRKISICR